MSSSSKRLSQRMSSGLASPTLAAMAAGAPPPSITSSRGGGGGGGTPVGSAAAAAMSMSAADVRGGLELLRGQVAALQAENDGLKHGRAALERERAQDLRYMRALLGRSLMRHHAQSFKMRRLLIHLHARVLDLAAVLNREQKICETRDNKVASVQEGDGETEAAAETIANEQRALFLSSLSRLRPVRVGHALQENLERLFDSVGEVVARCPRYRSELDYQFGRLIELKQQLLASQGERQQADQRCGALEDQMRSLAAQTDQFRAKNEKLARDMHQTIDVEKKRRLRDNAAYIKARTSLYKQILADKDSPLHPAHLAKVGKSGTNLLNSIATQMEHKRASLNGSSSGGGSHAGFGLSVNRQTAAQQADELERRHAHEHPEQETNDTAAAGEDAEQQPQSQPHEYEGDAAADDTDPASVADPSDPVHSDDPVDPSCLPSAGGADAFSRSEDMSGYAMAEEGGSGSDGSGSPRASMVEIEVDEKEEMQPVTVTSAVLPPIGPSQSQSQSQSHAAASRSLHPSSSAPSLSRLPFPHPFSLSSSLRAKPSAAYAANQRAEAAYRSSNDYLRHLAHEYTHHRFVRLDYATSSGSTAASAVAAAVAGSSSPAEAASSGGGGGGGGGGARPQFAKKESMLHPSPSLSFSSAQRIFAQRVGVGGNPGAHAPSNSVAHAAPWIPNFAAPALAHSPDSPPHSHSSSLPRVLGALDDMRSQAAFHASERRVHEGALAPRSAGIASPSAAAPAASATGAAAAAGTRKSKSHSAHHSSVSPSGRSNGAHESSSSHGGGRSASDWTDPLFSAGSTGHGGFAGSGAGSGVVGAGGVGSSKAARVPLSRRAAPSSVSPPAHSRKHATAVEHNDAPTHMRIIPASPRRDAGLF